MLLSLLIAFSTAIRAQDPALGKLQIRYQSETNPVQKAKVLAKLGPLEVDEAARNIKADQEALALSVLERYRDDARSSVNALVATQANASKHPAGFKELQIGLRESLRRLNDLVFLVPSDVQSAIRSRAIGPHGDAEFTDGSPFPLHQGKTGQGKGRLRRALMRSRLFAFACFALLLGLSVSSSPARAQKKDYLSAAEAEQIRDSDTPADRIKLFISFANDRIKKLQYEFAHPGDSLHRADRLNAMINGYTGCIDDASDLIELGADKQQNIRDGIKDMQAHAPEFLSYLKELAAKGAEVDDYKDNLDDAIDATSDAIRTADDAMKDLAPPPVRRKPS